VVEKESRVTGVVRVGKLKAFEKKTIQDTVATRNVEWIEIGKASRVQRIEKPILMF